MNRYRDLRSERNISPSVTGAMRPGRTTWRVGCKLDSSTYSRIRSAMLRSLSRRYPTVSLCFPLNRRYSSHVHVGCKAYPMRQVRTGRPQEIPREIPALAKSRTWLATRDIPFILDDEHIKKIFIFLFIYLSSSADIKFFTALLHNFFNPCRSLREKMYSALFRFAIF